MPIALRYDASGFRPNTPNGIIGQSYSLTGIEVWCNIYCKPNEVTTYVYYASEELKSEYKYIEDERKQILNAHNHKYQETTR